MLFVILALNNTSQQALIFCSSARTCLCKHTHAHEHTNWGAMHSVKAALFWLRTLRCGERLWFHATWSLQLSLPPTICCCECMFTDKTSERRVEARLEWTGCIPLKRRLLIFSNKPQSTLCFSENSSMMNFSPGRHSTHRTREVQVLAEKWIPTFFY